MKQRMKKLLALALSLGMVVSMTAACGKKTGGTTPGNGGGDTAKEGTFTYHDTTSMIATFSPTDWTISSEWDVISLTTSPLWDFVVNDTMDGYEIVPSLASEYPEDVTAEYAGNELYGVPADATEGYAWKVYLRQDAVWEDGEVINADDYEYTLQQFLNPEMKNYRASSYYSGNTALANGKAYYSQGGNLYTYATDVVGYIGSVSEANVDLYINSAEGCAWYGGGSIEDAINDGYGDYFTCADGTLFEDKYELGKDILVTDEVAADLAAMAVGCGDVAENWIEFCLTVTEADAMPWENVGFIKNDDFTFTVVLVNPCTEFDFEYGFGPGLLKEELYEGNKQDAGGITKSSYGTAVNKYASWGPYKLTEYQEGKQVSLAKNENWYGYSDDLYAGKYQTTDIVYHMIDDHTTQLTMFLQGELDAVGLTNDDMEDYGTSDYILYTPESYTYYLAFNIDKKTLKAEEEQNPGVNKTLLSYDDFRHGISLAIDRRGYVKECTACSDAAFGLLNDVYIADPATSLKYRDTDAAKQALCNVYGVNSVDDITGYDVKKASELIQKAYDAALANGDISETDKVVIDYHIYGSDAAYQKMVDFIDDALAEAAKGTSLEGRTKIQLVEDQDYYNSMQNGMCDLILGSWGGADMDPFSIAECYVSPDYMVEFGFDSSQDLTLTVNGQQRTMSFYQWWIALCEGEYTTADVDTRVSILAGIEEGLLSDSHILPLRNYVGASLLSQRCAYPCDYINSLVGRGGLAELTYSMNDEEWKAYCAEQNNQLTY